MSDIIAEVPWHCGNANNCTVGWHQTNYWCYADGSYSVDSYADGDHEGCDAEDVPTPEEIDAAWLDYSRWVAEHGEDPLGNFFIRRTKQTRERYRAEWRNSIAGPRLVSVKRAGRERLSDLPDHVQSYLDIGERTWDELIALPTVRTIGAASARADFVLEGKAPRSARAIQRELRKLARKHINKKENA